MAVQKLMVEGGVPRVRSGNAQVRSRDGGFAIRIPAGERVEIDWQVVQPGTHTIQIGADAQVVCYVEYAHAGLVAQRVELAEHAECVMIEAGANGDVTFDAYGGAESVLQHVALTMPTQNVKVVRTYHLEQPHASVQSREVVWAAGRGVHEQKVYVLHSAPHTTSQVKVKEVMYDASRSVVHGLVKINSNAVQSSSFLEAHALLMQKDASAQIIPALEIETSEVQRVGHATTVSPLDEEKVFYMMARGLSESEAKRMLIQGFVHDVLAGLPGEQQVWITRRLEALWQ